MKTDPTCPLFNTISSPRLILDPVAACLAFGPPDEVAAGAGAQVAHAMAQIGSREEDRVPRAAGGVEHLRRWEPCLQAGNGRAEVYGAAVRRRRRGRRAPRRIAAPAVARRPSSLPRARALGW